MKTLKSIPPCVCNLLSGAVIGLIVVYFFKRWKQIMQVADFSLQSYSLLIVLLLYLSYALFFLVRRDLENKMVILFASSTHCYYAATFMVLSSIIKIIFYVDAYRERPPFELIYVTNEVSTFVFLLCVFHIASVFILGKIEHDPAREKWTSH